VAWLSPDAWIDACGAPADGLRASHQPRGGEWDLETDLRRDRRRVAAIVSEPGAGSSRLALELARRAPKAFYRDPRTPPDESQIDALEMLLEARDERPVVVLDGPERDEALALLASLCARVLHPRLLVLVPCHPRKAAQLSALAGDLPRASFIVAALGGAEAPPPKLPEGTSRHALLPFALAGRVPAGRMDSEEQLLAQRLIAQGGDGVQFSSHAAPPSRRAQVERSYWTTGLRPLRSLVCLVDDRARFALVSQELAAHPDGAARLETLLEAHPMLRARAAASLLRWTGGKLPDALAPSLLRFGGDDFPDLGEWARRGIRLTPKIAQQLAARAEQLLAGALPDAQAAAVEESLARLVAADEARALSLLRSAHARTGDPRLAVMIAVATRDADACVRAAADAEGLERAAVLMQQSQRFAEARALCDRLMAEHQSRGHMAQLASAKLLASSVSAAGGDPDRALGLAELAWWLREALGDVRGAALAIYRMMGIETERANFDAVADWVLRALTLETHIGHGAGRGYCHWVLGALADRKGDAVSAADHYRAAEEGYRTDGLPVPPRILEALARATSAKSAADHPLTDELPPLPSGDQDLIAPEGLVRGPAPRR
jgi:hypothetical protein